MKTNMTQQIHDAAQEWGCHPTTKGATPNDLENVEACHIEFDRTRGVLYVNSEKTGTTLVRISGLMEHGHSLIGSDGQPVCLDVRVNP